jgi:hypothetical protein
MSYSFGFRRQDVQTLLCLVTFVLFPHYGFTHATLTTSFRGPLLVHALHPRTSWAK